MLVLLGVSLLPDRSRPLLCLSLGACLVPAGAQQWKCRERPSWKEGEGLPFRACC